MSLLTQQNYKRHRAICGALHTSRSALLAIACVWLPSIIAFVQNSTFTRRELLELLRTLSVALLIVIFNFVQRMREKEATPRRRRRPTTDEKTP